MNPPEIIGPQSLEQHPSIQNAREVIQLEERARHTQERYNSLILLRAIRLAPTLEVCEAILRGEPVPRSRLDPQWAKAYRI